MRRNRLCLLLAATALLLAGCKPRIRPHVTPATAARWLQKPSAAPRASRAPIVLRPRVVVRDREQEPPAEHDAHRRWLRDARIRR